MSNPFHVGTSMSESTWPIEKSMERLEAILVELWSAESIDLHMCDGTVKIAQSGLLGDMRRDIRAVLTHAKRESL